MTEVYDLRYRDGHLSALIATDDGPTLLDFPPRIKPYCYVKEGEYEKSKLEKHGCAVWDDAPDGFERIVAESPYDIRDFASDSLYDTYEADVSFSVRTMIDEGYNIAVPDVEDILYFDIEVDDRGAFAEPNKARDRILSIAAVGGDDEEFYFDDQDETDLVEKFLIAAQDYVSLVGWNAESYDFPYLENRAKQLGIAVDWMRWVRTDLMPLYDMLARPTETLSLKLDDTGDREFSEGKTDVSPGGGALYDLWLEDDDRLREYNLQDADLVRRVDERYGLVRLLHVTCDICNYPPGQAIYESKHGQVRFAIGQLVDAKLLDVASRKGIPQANKRAFSKGDDFPGGYVLEPKPGLYENVVVPDYSGMYPNIVRAINFGRETWYPDADSLREEHGEDARIIWAEHGVFVHPDDGGRSVPAEAADDLVDLREDSDEIVDKGVKAVNNTLYGVFAADHQRYFGPHSQNITLVGQKLTGTVERIANSGHDDISSVIYGDTDSVMIEMDDPDDPIDAAYRIADDVEAEMQEWARSKNANADYLTLDVDDVYDRFYIGDKKKRYFGHRIWKDDAPADDIKVRGFEYRQHDVPEPVRQFQYDLMVAKLYDEPISDIIESARNRLYSGELDMHMATKTGLGKPISEYKGTPPVHVRAASKIREIFGKEAAMVGSKVGYIKYGPNTRDWTWVHDGEMGRDLTPHHYEYLWQNEFESVMDAIDVQELEQKGLGDFA